MYEKIKRWYDLGLWNIQQVRDAVAKDILTLEQYKQITGEPYYI